jgi:hypothetical protein
MYLYNHAHVINSQLYKNTYSKFTSVYIRFINSLKVYCINFDLNIIKKKEDLVYLLYELKNTNKKDNEHTFRCKNCTMKNNVSFYNDIEDSVILQCEYCNSYRHYNIKELTPKMNTEILNYKNIGKYYINIKSSKIELHIVECIN